MVYINYISNKLNAYQLSYEMYTYKHTCDKACLKQYIMNKRKQEFDY